MVAAASCEARAYGVHAAMPMRAALHRLAEEVSARLRRRGLRGRTITLRARYPDFDTVTRPTTGTLPVDTAEPLLRVAVDLLAGTDAVQRGVRLLGLGVCGFAAPAAAVQLDLFTGGTVLASPPDRGAPRDRPARAHSP